MPRKPTPFNKPEAQRKHGLSPLSFQAVRLSHHASMAFGSALHGDAESVAESCQKAQVAIERLLAMTSHLLDQPGTFVPGTPHEGEK